MSLDLEKLAGRLTDAKKQTETMLDPIREHPDGNRQTMEKLLREYCGAKLLLSPGEISDNIVKMVRLNVAKASHMSVEALKEMDRPGRCGSAPAVLSKRVLLFLDIQKALHITLPPAKVPDIIMVQDLTKIILPLLSRNRDREKAE